MATCHLKSKKGTQLLFYMAIACHTNESVVCGLCHALNVMLVMCEEKGAVSQENE